MRLSLICNTLGCGGAGRVASHLANGFAGSGWTVRLMTTDDGKAPPLYQLRADVEYVALALEDDSRSVIDGALANLRRVLVIRRAILASRPDVLLSFLDRTNVLALLATRGLRIPVVVSERSDPAQRQIGRVWEVLRYCAYHLADALVCPARRPLRYFPPAIRNRSFVIPNPVSLSMEPILPISGLEPRPFPSRCFSALATSISLNHGREFPIVAEHEACPLSPIAPLFDGSRLPSEEAENAGYSRRRPVNAGLPGREPRASAVPSIVAMGSLRPEKGFDLLIEAFANVSSRHPEWSLTIWGEGPDRKGLEALKRDLRIDDRVRLPGVTREPLSRLVASDLFVLSSRVEGFPNVLVEAMAVGLPVIATDVGAVPEVIRNGLDGLIVRPGDVRALAGTMDRLMGDPNGRAALGGYARAVLIRFDLDHVLEKWKTLFLDVIRR